MREEDRDVLLGAGFYPGSWVGGGADRFEGAEFFKGIEPQKADPFLPGNPLPPVCPAEEETAMICPKCGGRAVVVDSRTYPTGEVRRRRKCRRCGFRFSTLEAVVKFEAFTMQK